MSKANWLVEPQEHDYPSAAQYLSLVLEPALVDAIVAALHGASMTTVKAKDLLRAARLPLLAVDNRHVSKDLKRINRGDALSPILLVRGDIAGDRPLVIADGYHRACAAYHLDENVEVPCKMVSLPTA